MKVAIYVRVSTRKQEVDNQKELLVKHCERNRWDYEVFEEVGSTRKSRPVKNNVLDKLRKRLFDGVLVYKLDRWARSTLELTMEVQELVQNNVAFISLKENIDLSSSTGKLQFHIWAAFAEFERDLIRERTLDGLIDAPNKKLNLDGTLKQNRRVRGKDKQARNKVGYFLRHMTPKQRQKYEEKQKTLNKGE